MTAKRKKRFFVETLPDTGTLTIEGTQAHHMTAVLRLCAGTPVVLFDSTGKAVNAKIENVAGGTVTVALLDREKGVPDPPIEITVYLSIVRPPAMEKAIVMCAELGAYAFIPLVTERSRSGGVSDRRDHRPAGTTTRNPPL